MNSTPQTETYLRELGRALAGLAAPDREEILLETRSHLAERGASVGEAEALRRLGPARTLASRYIAASGKAGAMPAEAGLARGAAPLVAATMLIGACLLWVCTLISLTLCLAELAEPSLVSIWLNGRTGNVFVGAANPDMVALLTDLAGPWFLPLAAVLSVLAGVSAFGMMRVVWREWRAPRGLLSS